MKSAVETLSPTRVKLTVEVPFAELSANLDAAYKKIASQVNVPGFRKGKVPSRIIDQRFGRGAVLEEAVNDALPHKYEDAVRESGVVPVGRPEVDVTELADGEHLTFTAEVDVRPDFDLPEYAGISVEVEPAEPTEADIEQQLTALRERFASYRTVERPAADGDVLLLDLRGTDDGEPVEDLQGSALSYEVGSGQLLEGLDDAVRGAAADEERTFTFTPTAGEYLDRPLEVTVTVKAVRERDLPAADDEFAQLASEFDTIDELRADITARLSRVKRLEQGSQAREKVHDALLDLVDIPLPESALTAEVEEHFQDGHGDDAHRAEFESNARRSLKSQFVLDKIADAEDLAVSEAELSQWLVGQAPRYGMAPDAFAQALVQAGQVAMAVSDVRRGKALSVVLEAATVVDTAGNPVDLAALQADLATAGTAAGHDHDHDHDDHDGHDHDGHDHEH